MQDARDVYEVQQTRLDLSYIQHWVWEVDVSAEW